MNAVAKQQIGRVFLADPAIGIKAAGAGPTPAIAQRRRRGRQHDRIARPGAKLARIKRRGHARSFQHDAAHGITVASSGSGLRQCKGRGMAQQPGKGLAAGQRGGGAKPDDHPGDDGTDQRMIGRGQDRILVQPGRDQRPDQPARCCDFIPSSRRQRRQLRRALRDTAIDQRAQPPAAMLGQLTDHRIAGRIAKQHRRHRQRPIGIGIDIGHREAEPLSAGLR